MAVYDDELAYYDEDYDPDPYDELCSNSGSDAWSRTVLHTNQDGTITGYTITNDNLDRGYANETASWPEYYPSLEALLKRYPRGGDYCGISGIHVTIELDGEILKPAKLINKTA